MNYDKICQVLRKLRDIKTNRVFTLDSLLYDDCFSYNEIAIHIQKFLNKYGHYWIVYDPNGAVSYTYWANLNYDCTLYLTHFIYADKKQQLSNIKLILVNDDLAKATINTVEKLEDIL